VRLSGTGGQAGRPYLGEVVGHREAKTGRPYLGEVVGHREARTGRPYLGEVVGHHGVGDGGIGHKVKELPHAHHGHALLQEKVLGKGKCSTHGEGEESCHAFGPRPQCYSA